MPQDLIDGKLLLVQVMAWCSMLLGKEPLTEPMFTKIYDTIWPHIILACFQSLAWSKLRLCSANHRPGHWSNLPCDWPSTAWASSEQETENRSMTWPQWLNTLRPRQNGRHFPDDISNSIFLNEKVWLIEISRKFVPKSPIDNIPALVQMMAWRRPGDKPLSEPMMARLPMHICVTRPQWVNPHHIGWVGRQIGPRESWLKWQQFVCQATLLMGFMKSQSNINVCPLNKPTHNII